VREVGVEVRIGVHTGEIQLLPNDIGGVAVHAAARVMSLAGPDEVLVTSTTRELLDGSDVVLEEAGTHALKGLSGRRQVFRLVMSPRDDVPV
jgi:class 3 adenylate cyclase